MSKSVDYLHLQTGHTTKLSAIMHYVKQKTWKIIGEEENNGKRSRSTHEREAAT